MNGASDCSDKIQGNRYNTPDFLRTISVEGPMKHGKICNQATRLKGSERVVKVE